MAIPHAYPGMPVDLRRQDEPPTEPMTTALVKNDMFEAIRLVIPKGHSVCHGHQLNNMITIHCLEGRIALTAGSDTRELPAGHWLFLNSDVPHTLTGQENSLVLLTVMFH